MPVATYQHACIQNIILQDPCEYYRSALDIQTSIVVSF